MRAFLVLVFLIVGIICYVQIYILAKTKKKIITVKKAAQFENDAIIVLGAGLLSDGSPSGMLEDRLTAAVQLYFPKKKQTILVSGNRKADYNEPDSMKKFLLQKGVLDRDIKCDYQGYTTFDTMIRARDSFNINRAVIVTQKYHLYRALYIANALGIESYGIPSDFHVYRRQNYYDFREMFARVKAVLQVNTER